MENFLILIFSDFSVFGFIGYLYPIALFLIYIGVIILMWNAFIALRIYIKKNREPKE